MMSDDTPTKFKPHNIATSDDDKLLAQLEPNEDSIMYAGDSINEILAYFNTYARADIDIEAYPQDYWFHNLASPDADKPIVGCLFCHRKITIASGCYMFCQTREQYDRDILLVACSDACPQALKTSCVSKCHLCERDYLHDRYDNDICRRCLK